MIKIIKIFALLILLQSLHLISNAQFNDYRKLRIALGTGAAVHTGYDGEAGILAFVEPAYRLNDTFILGFKLEVANHTPGLSRPIGTVNEKPLVTSAVLTGQYYFTEKYFRPFAGIGIGYFKSSDALVRGNFNNQNFVFQKSDGMAGGLIRIGFDYGHFMLAANLNFQPDTQLSNFLEVKNTYSSFCIAWVFGGGLN